MWERLPKPRVVASKGRIGGCSTWWVTPGVDTLLMSLGYGESARGGRRRPTLRRRTMGASRRSRCRNQGSVCLVLNIQRPRATPPASLLPSGCEKSPRISGLGKSSYTHILPPNFTLVPPGEMSEVVQDSVKSLLSVGYRTRTRYCLV